MSALPDFLTSGLLTAIVFSALAALSVMAVGIGIFKTVQFSRLGVGQRGTAETILQKWLSGSPDEAIRDASGRRTVLSRVLQAVFSAQQSRPGDTAFAEELGRQSAIVELAQMTERMRVLEMVVQAAPMLGLLGTVVGMIDAFSVLAQVKGAADPAGLAGGIWVALTTTAAGLAVALIAYFIATWLDSRIDRERNMIETLISAAIYGRVETGTRPS